MTMETAWLRGCATALVTPFTETGAIDEQCLRELIEHQIDGRIRLLVPCGTTGESATMSDEEDQVVIRLTIEAARGRAKVIAGTGSNSTVTAIQYSQLAESFGADAILSVAPYYNKPTQEGLFVHFKAIAESVPNLPVVIYNVPGRTSSNIAAQTTIKLAREVENIVAVKEASGNLSQIMEIISGKPDGFHVISGDDSMTLAIIALGGEGLISVASNEIPGLMSQLVDLALAGDWEEARRLHYRLLPLMEANFIESSPGPVKAAMSMLGLLSENLRLPLVPVQQKTRERLKEILLELGLLKETSHATA